MRLFSICLLGLLGSSLWASRKGDLREHTQAATSIVMGDVAETRSYYGSDGEIYTDVSVRVSAFLKERSRKNAGFRTFTVKGGSVGDTRVMFTDSPSFEADESVVVFLQGDQASEKYSIRGGWVPELGERASQMLGKIQQHLADSDEPMVEMERRRAHDFLQEAAATPPAPDAACFALIGPKWIGSMATYKTGTTIPATWKTSLDAASASWGRTGTPFSFRADAASTNEFLLGTVSGTSTLASTRIEYDSTNRMRRFTMTFNSAVQWSPTGEAGKFDIENVTAHELGHALGLNHPTTAACGEQTMWASAGAGETNEANAGGRRQGGRRGVVCGGFGDAGHDARHYTAASTPSPHCRRSGLCDGLPLPGTARGLAFHDLGGGHRLQLGDRAGGLYGPRLRDALRGDAAR